MNRRAKAFADGLDPQWPWERIVALLDHRLIERLETVKAPDHFSDLAAACALLKNGHQVNGVALHLGAGRRQLHRWFRDQVGMGPKQFMDLERLQRSLSAMQGNSGDPVEGYCDQAHQIRTWRRRLGLAPGSYVRSALSQMPAFRGDAAVAAAPFYL